MNPDQIIGLGMLDDRLAKSAVRLLVRGKTPGVVGKKRRKIVK